MNKRLLQFTSAALIIAATSYSQTGRTVGNAPALSVKNSVQSPSQTMKVSNRGCATGIPSAEWEAEFQKQIEAFKAEHALPNGKTQMVNYTIPVIIHVIHGGQAIGTYPNLAQGQLNSQISVLNADYGGSGMNVSNYPASAFSAYVTAAGLSGANVDGSGRVAISNTGIQFCLALTDSMGNTLAEPGIDRINYTSKGWSNPNSFTSISTFQNFINNTVKPQTIWNVSKYLNIWVTDENASVGLLGYATFPVSTGLTGLSGPYGTSSNDGFWAYAKAFGSSTLFPGGTYISAYDKGRTCSHEIAHWIGLRHIWGDGTCATDYCNDTPPAASSNFGTPTYPFNVGTCAGPPSNSPNGEMFMNFMDYTDDVAMYMFTTDQATRMQTAMANSPYRKFLGTHGLCSVTSTSTAFCGDTITTVVNTQTMTLATAGADASTPGCSPKAGYIFGSNCYQDQEKAEFYPFSMYSSVTTPKITSVIVIFYKDATRGTGGNSSTAVNMKLYNGSMAGGPTTSLGQVNSNLGNILAAVSTTSVNYCGPAVVYTNPILKPYRFVTTSAINAPGSGGFFASLTLPTTAGDTAVVMHSAATTGTNWEKWSDNTWHNLASTWGSFNASMAILPVISCNFVGIDEHASVLNDGITLMPNPSAGQFNLVATLPNAEDLNVTVTNALGQIISNTEFKGVNNQVFTVDLTNKDNGVYFITISNGTTSTVKKVVIAK